MKHKVVWVVDMYGYDVGEAADILLFFSYRFPWHDRLESIIVAVVVIEDSVLSSW